MQISWQSCQHFLNEVQLQIDCVQSLLIFFASFALQMGSNKVSLRKGQERYQWRLAEVRCLLVENYSNSRQVWSSRSFLQFLGGLRPNIFMRRWWPTSCFSMCTGTHDSLHGLLCLSTVLTQDHFYSDWCIYKLHSSPLLFLRWCSSTRELLGSCRLVSTWWYDKHTGVTEQLVPGCMHTTVFVFVMFTKHESKGCFKLTWLVLGGDPAARSHRVEQFTALWGL